MDFCNNQSDALSQKAMFQAILDRINRPGQFSSDNGMRVTEVGEYSCAGELTVTPGSLNPRGIVHGGCMATLMDTVAGVAACTGGMSCVTLNCSISYLRPAENTQKVYCRTRLIKAGRTVVVMEAILTDDNGRELATGTYTFYLLEPLENILHK